MDVLSHNRFTFFLHFLGACDRLLANNQIMFGTSAKKRKQKKIEHVSSNSCFTHDTQFRIASQNVHVLNAKTHPKNMHSMNPNGSTGRYTKADFNHDKASNPTCTTQRAIYTSCTRMLQMQPLEAKKKKRCGYLF